MITVLDSEANVLEIYQASAGSLWSCVARVVLPPDVALCRRTGRAAARGRSNEKRIRDERRG